jgi:hypothetical protein
METRLHVVATVRARFIVHVAIFARPCLRLLWLHLPAAKRRRRTTRVNYSSSQGEGLCTKHYNASIQSTCRVLLSDLLPQTTTDMSRAPYLPHHIGNIKFQ